MPTPLPYQFPNHADEIHREAIEYRRRSPSDRLLAIMDVMALGEAMLRESPNRDYALAQWEAHERQWQYAHREVLRQNGF